MPTISPLPSFFKDIKINHTLHPTCLTSWPVYHIPKFSRAQKTSSACFQNVPVLKICEALTQSNPLTYVSLYALILATGLGDRQGWGFFQTFLDRWSFTPWPGCCLFFTSKWGLQWSSKRDGNSLGKFCILQKFNIPWDCLFWWPR